MVVSYISIGNKRTRNYQNKLDKIHEDNENMEMINKEMEGKLKMLNDVAEKNQNENLFPVTSQGDGDNNNFQLEIEQCNKAKEDLKRLFNLIENNKNMVKQNQEDYINNITGFLVEN